MKKLLFVLISCSLLLSGCSKKDDTTSGSGKADDTSKKDDTADSKTE